MSLKVLDKKIGFYENNTHNLINIDYCYLCNDILNKILKDLPLFKINNGLITVKCNYKNELLIVIETEDKICNIDYFKDNYLITGIILNNKTIYGDNYFIDKINDYLFKVSYNSFFQVNPYICGKLFELIKKYTLDSRKILDLYSGVGTLSIVSSNNNNTVLGIEIVENATNDSNFNKLINKKDNISFICSDTKKQLIRLQKNMIL